MGIMYKSKHNSRKDLHVVWKYFIGSVEFFRSRSHKYLRDEVNMPAIMYPYFALSSVQFEKTDDCG